MRRKAENKTREQLLCELKLTKEQVKKWKSLTLMFKQADEQFKASEERLQRVVETLRDVIIWSASPGDFKLYYVSSSIRRVLGIAPEDISPNLLHDLVHPRDRERVHEAVAVCFWDGYAEAEFRVFRADGKVRWLNTRAWLKREAEGVPLIVDGVTIDITERKRTEAALKASIRQLKLSQARYRAIAEDRNELVCRFKKDGVLTFVNDAYCRCFGKTRQELVGSNLFSFILEQDRDRVLRYISALSPNNPAVTCERRVLGADGRVHWQQCTDRVIFDAAGNLIEFQSVGRDITEYKQREESLEKGYRELEAMILEKLKSLRRCRLSTRLW